jgi:hypothetical protein
MGIRLSCPCRTPAFFQETVTCCHDLPRENPSSGSCRWAAQFLLSSSWVSVCLNFFTGYNGQGQSYVLPLTSLDTRHDSGVHLPWYAEWPVCPTCLSKFVKGCYRPICPVLLGLHKMKKAGTWCFNTQFSYHTFLLFISLPTTSL